MKRKSKRGVDLICRKHGPEAVLIEECEPSSPHNFVLKCKKCRKPYQAWASAKQVEAILKAYPNCDAREYREKSWDILFERVD